MVNDYEKHKKELQEYAQKYIDESYPLLKPETMFNLLNNYKVKIQVLQQAEQKVRITSVRLQQNETKSQKCCKRNARTFQLRFLRDDKSDCSSAS